MAVYNDPPKKKDSNKEEGYQSSVKNFFLRYYNSPAFERNYKRGQKGWFPDDFKKVKDELTGLVKSVLVKSGKTSESPDTYYDYRTNDINMGEPNLYGNQDMAHIFGHEVSHLGDPLVIAGSPRNTFAMLNRNRYWRRILENNKAKGLKPGDEYYDTPARREDDRKKDIGWLVDDIKFINRYGSRNPMESKDENIKTYIYNYNKLKAGGESTHDNAPSEVRADINALRYLLAEKGIWDVTSENPGSFDVDKLNKLYKIKELNKPFNKNGAIYHPTNVKPSLQGVTAPKSAGLFLNRLRERYTDEDIIWMINNIAKKGESKSDMA